MKITLYMATSADGFIAKKNGDSDWVSEVDTVNFERAFQENGCVIVGRKTFDQYIGDIYPLKGVTNYIITSDSTLKSENPKVVYLTGSVAEIVTAIEQKGHDKVLLIGGGSTNAAFLRAGVIDEMILSIHPLLLGSGMRLFESAEEMDISLQLISETKLDEGLLQVKYKILK